MEAKALKSIVRQQIGRGATVIADDMSSYHSVDQEFFGHDVVRRSSGEYAQSRIYTNTIENYFSILERGLVET